MAGLRMFIPFTAKGMTMTISNPNPDKETLKTWGVLAYVTERDRKEILESPYGNFKPRVKALEKEIKEMKKRKKKESGN